MSKEDYIKLPRLYVDQELKENTIVSFNSDQAHYLKNVMRRKNGDCLRLFNGRDGEWVVLLTTLEKKRAEGVPDKQLYAQPEKTNEVHLIFTPIKKARMDFLIEKAVELGVTHLHPILTQNTETRKINTSRVRQQIIEAAEQCERLAIPVFYDLENLENTLNAPDIKTLYACIERSKAPKISKVTIEKNTAVLIGPEGGFTKEEKEMLGRHNKILPVSLGDYILRSETAALYALSAIKMCGSK